MGQEMAVDFDLNEMPNNIAQRLHNLINASDFFEIPVCITVVAANSIHTIRTTDTSMPESLRPLVEELTELAKTV